MPRKMKMTRESAELIVDAIDHFLEYFGISIEKFAASNSHQLMRILPKKFSKYFRYGSDREGIIKYFMTHSSEPSAGERAAFTAAAVQLPRMMRQALIEGDPSIFTTPRRANYRTKISPKERVEACKQVKRRMAKSQSFAQAMREVAEMYDVNPRTIRRIWYAWEGKDR